MRLLLLIPLLMLGCVTPQMQPAIPLPRLPIPRSPVRPAPPPAIPIPDVPSPDGPRIGPRMPQPGDGNGVVVPALPPRPRVWQGDVIMASGGLPDDPGMVFGVNIGELAGVPDPRGLSVRCANRIREWMRRVVADAPGLIAEVLSTPSHPADRRRASPWPCVYSFLYGFCTDDEAHLTARRSARYSPGIGQDELIKLGLPTGWDWKAIQESQLRDSLRTCSDDRALIDRALQITSWVAERVIAESSP